MTRLILIICICFFCITTYADSSTYKRSVEDEKCFQQIALFKENPNNEKLIGIIEFLMVNTSHSKLSLYTIEQCTAELNKVIASNDSLKSNKYLLDYYSAILTYCKGDSVGFVNQIEKLKSELLKDNRFVEYASINVQAGNFFSLYNVIDLRFKFYRDNISFFHKNKNVNWEEYDLQNYNSIAFLFENIFQYDSALKYYNIGLELAKKINSEVWYGLMSGNLGVIYLKNKDYSTAKSLLTIDLNASIKHKMHESALNVMFNLILISNHDKNFAESKRLLDSAASYFKNVDSTNIAYKILFTNRLYFTKAEFFMGLGQYDSAMHYYKLGNDYLYSLNRDYRKKEKTLLNERYNFEEKALILKELEIKNKQTIFVAIITSILFTSTVIILIILSRFNKRIKQKSEELGELNLQKDKLFSIISHDLKSPLNTLHSLLDLYNIDAISNEDFIKYKSEVNKTINEISGNLNNLLVWASRSMKSGVQVEKTYVNLSHLINDVISQSSVLLNNKKLNITVDNQYNNDLNVDRNMLFVVLNNLINNSIKFTTEQKTISIKVYQLNFENIEIEIEDQGIGIAKYKLESIFNLRANKSTMGTSGEKGTGLGLIICYEFVELMGGTIKVESEVNKGSRFIISLPIS